MDIPQIEAAIEAATYQQLDDISRHLWRSYGQGEVDDTQANALSGAIDGRRAALGSSRRSSSGRPFTAHPSDPRGHCRSPNRARSIARRRQLAASGAVPGRIAASFTTGELAVLTVLAREIQRSGSCDWYMDRIAALAGVSRTTARNSLRQARTLGLLSIEERRRHRWRNDTNVISIVSPEWIAWLRLGGGRKKSMTTNNHLHKNGEHTSMFLVCSSHQPAHVLNGKDGKTSTNARLIVDS